MKLLGPIIKVSFKICLFGLVAVLVSPLVYFAWRANQPMELPQFDGRTYIEWLEGRRVAYADLAEQYRSSRPKQEVKDGICFLTEVGVQIVAAVPNSGFYALAGIYPSLQSFTNPRDLRDGLVPQGVTWAGFLPAWWETFEKFVWAMAEHSPHGPVPYCRISLS
jgi:hypothetical protein